VGEPIRIAYMIGSMRRGGAEGQVVELLRHFNQGDFRASLYLLAEAGEHLETVRAIGARVRGFDFERRHRWYDPRLGWHVFKTVRRIEAALGEDQPQIFHAFLYWANVLGAWAASRARVPCVIASRRSLGFFKDGRPWLQSLENWANGRVHRVTVNSKAVLEDVLARERIRSEKIRLIHNGVAVEATPRPEEIAPFLRNLGLSPESRAGLSLIVCVANLIHYKGHQTLIEAMAEVVQALPNARLILVGRDGGMEAALRRRVTELNLERAVIFAGPQSALRPVYAAADLVVLASDEEGFSNVILEAMAAGRAIVATAVGGVPEAIEHGRQGLLVPPHDPTSLARAIIEALREAGLRARLGMAARERASGEFSLDRMLAAHEALYRECLQSAAGGPHA